MRKNGFTLAEVLITLAIIGIVAALTIPTLMTDSRLQLVSSRVAKFVSVTEDAALAQAAMNGTISATDLENIILFKSKEENGSNKIYHLKDGTLLSVDGSINEEGNDKFQLPSDYDDPAKYGAPVVGLRFEHNVSGLSNFNKSLYFVMTNKGYVFPNANDNCASALFDTGNDSKTPWKITKDMIKEGGACNGG